MKIIPTLTLLVPCLLLLAQCAKTPQFNPKRLQQSISNNTFTLVYFFSATCQYCQTFTPKFQQLAKDNKIPGLVFGRLDGPAYPALTEKYNVYSYPSIALFWKNIDQPIFYRRERQIAQIVQFLDYHTKPISNKVTAQELNKLTPAQRNEGILYIGDTTHQQNINIFTVLSFLEQYRPFAIHQANVSRPYIEIKGQQYYDFDIGQLKQTIRKQFAKLHIISQQSWLSIHQKKQLGIVFIDISINRNITGMLSRLAPEYPDIIFLRVDPSQEQYRDALNALGVESEQLLLGVDERLKAKFAPEKPYTEQSIRAFIAKLQNQTATLYMRSQKTNHKQKLTRDNYQQKIINDPKDVVVFLYRQSDRAHAKFMDLFRHLTDKLKNNTNLSMLRCNLSKNQIEMKLGFEVKVTPSIIFLAHRVKDRPVHYLNSVISAEGVIEFIMENTTFDWEDEWGEL